MQTQDTTTEQKIKEAAKTIFHKKGFAATRTRDIAEEAGFNLALLNYYFLNKKKLFEVVMIETVTNFMQTITTVINNKESSLEDKIEMIAYKYIDFIIKESDVPIFILSEIRNNVGDLLEKLSFKPLLANSVFFNQYKEAVAKGQITDPSPLNFFTNLMGLIIFPFIARPLLQQIGEVDDVQFEEAMQARKTMIPIWINSMFYQP